MAQSEDFSRFKIFSVRILQAATAITILAFLVRETVDADTWWQVAIGRDILDRLAVPSVDAFSAAAFGRPYHDSHWLFQVVAATADRLAGMAGVSWLMILIWCITLVACYSAVRRWVSPELACLFTFVVAMACSDRFTPRPDIITAMMIALFTLRLQQERFDWRDMALLGALQVIWTNAHGLFVIGPFMAGCYWVGEVWRAFRRQEHHLRQASVLLGVILCASLLSPFGWQGWQYALLLATEAGPAAPAFFATLAELTPTFGAVARSAPDFWFFLLLLILVPISLVVARKEKVSLSRLLIVLGLLVSACTGRRNIILFAIPAAPLIAENMRHIFARIKIPAAAATTIAIALLVSIFFPLSGAYYRMLNYPQRFGVGATPVLFPEEFPRFLRSSGYRGQLYNSNYLGGYCLYHGIRPLTDGRWEVYDPELLSAVLAASADRALWEQVVARFRIDGVLLLHGSIEAPTLLPQLHAAPRWRLVYADRALSFWAQPESVPSLPAVQPARLTSLLTPDARVEECVMLGSFLAATGAPEAAIAAFRQALATGGMNGSASLKLGRVLTDTGRFQEAEQVYLALVRKNEDDGAALNELAFLAYRRGDARQAEQYLQQALAANPDDADAKANLQRIRGSAP